MKKHELGPDSYSRRKQIRKLVHSSEGSRSLNRRIELKFGGVVDMGIPQQMNGWIFQRTSELGSGDHALNSSRFPSRFDRAPVYRRLPEIPPSELDEIWHGCCRLNSAQFHRRNRQSDARGGGGSGYKFAVRKKQHGRPRAMLTLSPRAPWMILP
jgi:hypothetical protein